LPSQFLKCYFNGTAYQLGVLHFNEATSLTADILSILKELCTIPGPVGREDLVQDYMQNQLERYSTETHRDRLGNLRITIVGTEKHYAVVAHADEVGFFVSNIDEKGFLRAKWSTQGYEPDLRLLPGQRINLMTDSGMIPGCFCVKTAHIAGAKDKKRIPSWEEVFIDIGARSPEEVKEFGIEIGTPALYATEVKEIGRHIMGKSFDDRVGLAMIVKLAERLSEVPKEERPTISFVSTVMEEIGAKGASAVARDLDVDGVIILEIGLADDHPGTHGEAGIELGKGPVIVIKDSQLVYSHKQNRRIFDIAEKENIPIQRAVYHNYATDGFQIVSHGFPVSVVGVPCRYSHSSFETINLGDVETSIELVYRFLLSESG